MLGVASEGSEAEEAAESPCGLARSVGDDDPGLQGDGGVVGDTECDMRAVPRPRCCQGSSTPRRDIRIAGIGGLATDPRRGDFWASTWNAPSR